MKIRELINQLIDLETTLRQIEPELEINVIIQHYDGEMGDFFYNPLNEIEVHSLVGKRMDIVLV